LKPGTQFLKRVMLQITINYCYVKSYIKIHVNDMFQFKQPFSNLTETTYGIQHVSLAVIVAKQVKERIAVNGYSHLIATAYGTSLAIWDHTVLPATRHK